MSFSPEKHIEKMEPSVKKLLAQLKSKGVEFTPQDESGLNNVVFRSSDKTVKISQHSFYRFSGIAVYTKSKGEHESETVEVTDEMYMQIFMKPIIETFFGIK